LLQGRFLGQGIDGPIYEMASKCHAFAWKTRFSGTKITGSDRKELSVLKRLDHSYNIKFVSSCTQQKFLGLPFYLVAVCDIGELLGDLEELNELGVNSAFLHSQPYIS